MILYRYQPICELED